MGNQSGVCHHGDAAVCSRLVTCVDATHALRLPGTEAEIAYSEQPRALGGRQGEPGTTNQESWEECMTNQPIESKSDIPPVLAHMSEDGRCQLLRDHLVGTATRAREFADAFGCREWRY